jgi:nucleoid DNA-binding protein
MGKKIFLNNITSAIYEKCNKTISKIQIKDALGMIIDDFVNKLSDGEPYYISNFGVFLPVYSKKGRTDGEYTPKDGEFDGSIGVRFIPHENFKASMNDRVKAGEDNNE